MKLTPAQIRNAAFRELIDQLHGQRQTVLDLWRQHTTGEHPLTTAELADKTGFSLLTLRPRTTELHQLGFLQCVGRVARQGGLYRALSTAEVRRRHQAQQQADTLAQHPQLSL